MPQVLRSQKPWVESSSWWELTSKGEVGGGGLSRLCMSGLLSNWLLYTPARSCKHLLRLSSKGSMSSIFCAPSVGSFVCRVPIGNSHSANRYGMTNSWVYYNGTAPLSHCFPKPQISTLELESERKQAPNPTRSTWTAKLSTSRQMPCQENAALFQWLGGLTQFVCPKSRWPGRVPKETAEPL
jgi:hypothetical protein